MKCHVTQNSQKIYSIYNIKYLFAIYISICMSIISKENERKKKKHDECEPQRRGEARRGAQCATLSSLGDPTSCLALISCVFPGE